MRIELNLDIECLSEHELKEVLKNKNLSKRDKNIKVMELLQCSKTDKQLKAVIALMCGMKVKLADLFDNPTLTDTEKSSISFSEESYDELPLLWSRIYKNDVSL